MVINLEYTKRNSRYLISFFLNEISIPMTISLNILQLESLLVSLNFNFYHCISLRVQFLIYNFYNYINLKYLHKLESSSFIIKNLSGNGKYHLKIILTLYKRLESGSRQSAGFFSSTIIQTRASCSLFPPFTILFIALQSLRPSRRNAVILHPHFSS